MCYRCEICRRVVPHGVSRRVWTIHRKVAGRSVGVRGQTVHAVRGEIAQEIPVCGSCHGALSDGVSFRELTRRRHSQVEGREVATVEGKWEPIPAPPIGPAKPVDVGRSVRRRKLQQPIPPAETVRQLKHKE